MNSLIYVALGGALGASLRHILGEASKSLWGTGYPYGTFVANILGGFLMGALVGWLALRVSGGENLRLLFGVGLLGGFTTFSAFSLEAFVMFERKAYTLMAWYIGASVILSIAALMFGLWCSRKVFGA